MYCRVLPWFGLLFCAYYKTQLCIKYTNSSSSSSNSDNNNNDNDNNNSDGDDDVMVVLFPACQVHFCSICHCLSLVGILLLMLQTIMVRTVPVSRQLSILHQRLGSFGPS